MAVVSIIVGFRPTAVGASVSCSYRHNPPGMGGAIYVVSSPQYTDPIQPVAGVGLPERPDTLTAHLWGREFRRMK